MKKFLIMVLLVLISAVMAEAKGHHKSHAAASHGILGENTLLKLVVINHLVNNNHAHVEGQKVVADSDLYYVSSALDDLKFWESKKQIIEIKKGQEIKEERNYFLSPSEISEEQLEKTTGDICWQIFVALMILAGSLIIAGFVILIILMLIVYPIMEYIDHKLYERKKMAAKA